MALEKKRRAFDCGRKPLSRLLHLRLAGFELIERGGARFRGLRGACFFHVPVSTDRLIGLNHANGGRMRREGQALREVRNISLEFGDQAPLELALVAVAERIEPCRRAGISIAP